MVDSKNVSLSCSRHLFAAWWENMGSCLGSLATLGRCSQGFSGLILGALLFPYL